jgi:hypothetical protein
VAVGGRRVAVAVGSGVAYPWAGAYRSPGASAGLWSPAARRAGARARTVARRTVGDGRAVALAGGRVPLVGVLVLGALLANGGSTRPSAPAPAYSSPIEEGDDAQQQQP